MHGRRAAQRLVLTRTFPFMGRQLFTVKEMTDMKAKTIIAVVTLTLAVLWATAPAYAGGAVRAFGAIWANGELYDTILTPATFRTPPAQSVDILYNFGMSGLQGQRSVSESAPGDPAYNGGRWSVKIVVFTEEGRDVHDPDGDGLVNFELKSAAEVLQHAALGHLNIIDTSIYFECPLLPRQ